MAKKEAPRKCRFCGELLTGETRATESSCNECVFEGGGYEGAE